MTAFQNHTKNYLVALLTEKGITNDIDNDMNVEGHINLTYRMQIDFICAESNTTQETIRKNFVKIDFLNGDVKHFWDYITAGMLKACNY